MCAARAGPEEHAVHWAAEPTMGNEERRNGVQVHQREEASNRAMQDFRQYHLQPARGVDR